MSIKTRFRFNCFVFAFVIAAPFLQLTAATEGDSDTENEIDLYDRNRNQLDFSPYDYPDDRSYDNNNNNPTLNNIHPGDEGYYYKSDELRGDSDRNRGGNNNNNSNDQNSNRYRGTQLEADLYDRNRNQLDFNPYDYPSDRSYNNNYSNPTRNDIHPGDEGYYYQDGNSGGNNQNRGRSNSNSQNYYYYPN